MADKLYGYVGNILRVNLTTGKSSVFSSEKYRKDYLGGKGFAAAIYWDEVPPEVKPFDPENKLIFTSGPANGTGAFQCSKGCLAGKSPTWYPVSSFTHSTTGNFSPMMKRAGFDAIIVEGKADHPVYLWVCDGRVEIRDAYDLWGKTTKNTRELLWKKHHKNVVVACIGPAGENKVVSACVTVACNQVFGRGGFGAVFGSKNLKAVVVYGKTRINVAEPMKLLEINRDRSSFNNIKVGEKRMVGGQEVVGTSWEETGAYNFGSVGAENQLRDMARLGRVRIKPNGCEGCGVFCRTKYNFYDKSMPDTSVICASNQGAAMQEAIANNWSKKLLGPDSYMFANRVDDLGLNINDFTLLAPLYGHRGKFDETEFVEGTLQGGDWLYQAYLHGILTKENTGIPFDKFGTDEYNNALLNAVVYRKGFGDVLANGFRYATQYIMEHEEFGPDRDKIMYIYKRIYGKAGNMGCLENGHGQYYPNPGRAIYTALGDRTGSEPEFQWATMKKAPNGLPNEIREKWIGEGSGKLMDLYYWGPEVAHAVIRHEEYASIMDSMQECAVGQMNGGIGFARSSNRPYKQLRDPLDWLNYTPTGGSEILSAVLGEDLTNDALCVIGDRIVNLVRAIWVRDGYTTYQDDFWGGEVDTLWDLHFERKGPDGVNLTSREGFLATRADYYKERGWVDGVPTRETLEKLNMKHVADELEARGLLKG